MTKQEQLRGKPKTFDKTVKNKTMEELVFKDIAKESILQTTESGLITEKETPILGIEQMTKAEKNREFAIQNWIKYNKSVLELDKRYSEGIELINGDILVRLFKKPMVDKYGFHKQNMVHFALRNGAAASVPDKYAFNFIGVITNTDKLLESKYPKGTVIQISPEVSNTIVFGEKHELQALKYGFYRNGDEDVDFGSLGYVLIKQGHLLSIIKDFDIEEYTKVQEAATLKSTSKIII
jgi:hypothetical protein